MMPNRMPASAVRERLATPGVVTVALAIASGLVVLNIATLVSSNPAPWLIAADLVSDLMVLGIGVFAFVRLGLQADADAARMRAALDAANTQLAAVVESAMDAIISVDDTQTVVLFNRAAEQVFGCAREDALGKPLERFMPARYRQVHRHHVARFGTDGSTSRRMGEQTVLWGLRADGTEFPIEASISQTTLDGERLYTVILRDVTRRKQADDALRQQQAELSELSARVLEAREEEKTLIARELHDELGQQLTALKMDMAWLRDRLPSERPELADKAGQMNALIDQTVGSVRRISSDLRPLMLDDLGLVDATGWLVDDFARRSGVACTLDVRPDLDLGTLDRSVATAVYRALQESLTNVGRHAQARRAWVLLGERDGGICLEVEDDGRGIDPADVSKARSLGLKGMRERARYLGGNLEVMPAPRGGTRVRLCIPLTPAPRESA